MSEGSEGLPEGSEELPEVYQGQIEGSEGLPEGSEGLPGGLGGTDGRTEFLPILQDFVPSRGRCPKNGSDVAGCKTPLTLSITN